MTFIKKWEPIHNKHAAIINILFCQWASLKSTKALVYYIIHSVCRPWARVYRARFPQMMIIAACLSHTTAAFSPHRYAFDTPVFITSERLARAQQDLAEYTSPIRVKRNSRAFVWFGRTVCWVEQMHREQHSETRKKTNGNLCSRSLAKLRGWT